MLAAVYLLLLVDAFLVGAGALFLLSMPPLIRALRRRRRRIPLAIVIAGSLMLSGCLADDECAVADDQPKVDICVSGLEAAAEYMGLPMQLVIPLCESVTVGDDCIVVCSIKGRGLICDSGSCEEHAQP